MAADAARALLKDDSTSALLPEYKQMYRAAMAGATLKLRGRKLQPPKMAFEE